jgi:hypothetical protein
MDSPQKRDVVEIVDWGAGEGRGDGAACRRLVVKAAAITFVIAAFHSWPADASVRPTISYHSYASSLGFPVSAAHWSFTKWANLISRLNASNASSSAIVLATPCELSSRQ